MNLMAKPTDTPELAAAKLRVLALDEAARTARRLWEQADKAEARARFDLIVLAHGLKEGNVYTDGKNIGILIARDDNPYAALHAYMKNGELSKREFLVHYPETLKPASPPAVVPA